ncbi:MAG: CARDB domain-containing protein, partial [Thermoplasmata archaeon]
NGIGGGNSVHISFEWLPQPGQSTLSARIDSDHSTGDIRLTDNRVETVFPQVPWPSISLADIDIIEGFPECAATAKVAFNGVAYLGQTWIEFRTDGFMAGTLRLEGGMNATGNSGNLSDISQPYSILFEKPFGDFLYEVKLVPPARYFDSNLRDNRLIINYSELRGWNSSGGAGPRRSFVELPNLKVLDLNTSKELYEMCDGEEVLVFANITNTGGTLLSAFEITFLLDGKTIGTATCPGLSPKQVYTAISAIKPGPGFHRISVFADLLNAVVESVEDDNYYSISTGMLQYPNLVVGQIKNFRADSAGNYISKIRVANSGGTTFSHFEVGLSSEGRLLGKTSLQALAAGKSADLEIIWRASDITYLEVFVDTANIVKEASKKDNYLNITFTVAADLTTLSSSPAETPLDLQVKEMYILPSKPVAGQKVFVFIELENTGGYKNSTLPFRMSLTGTGRTALTFSLSAPLPAFKTLVVESFIAASGFHRLYAKADSEDIAQELNEVDNLFEINFTVGTAHVRVSSGWSHDINTTGPFSEVVEVRGEASANISFESFSVGFYSDGEAVKEFSFPAVLPWMLINFTFAIERQGGEELRCLIIKTKSQKQDGSVEEVLSDESERLIWSDARPMPDLCISEAFFITQPREGTAPVLLEFVVTNSGRLPSRSSTVEILQDSTRIGVFFICPLSANTSVRYITTITAPVLNSTVSFRVDAYKELKESNESNNFASLKYPSGSFALIGGDADLFIRFFNFTQYRPYSTSPVERVNSYRLMLEPGGSGNTTSLKSAVVRFIFDGVHRYSFTISPSSPEAIIDMLISCNISSGTGPHMALVILDPTWIGDETDEENNRAYLYIGPNEPPFARAPDDMTVVLDTEVTLDASESRDYDGYIVRYRWDFGADGTWEVLTTEPKIKYTFRQNGTFQVVLEVEDNMGAFATDVFYVHVIFEEEWGVIKEVSKWIYWIINVAVIFVLLAATLLIALRSRKESRRLKEEKEQIRRQRIEREF